MHFIQYGRALVRGIKVDWDATVEITDEIRRAMLPQEELERLRAGRLSRPLRVDRNRQGRQASPLGSRDVIHPKGAVIFATSGEESFWVETKDEGPRGR